MLNKRLAPKNLDEQRARTAPRFCCFLDFFKTNNLQHVIADAKVENELQDLERTIKKCFVKNSGLRMTASTTSFVAATLLDSLRISPPVKTKLARGRSSNSTTPIAGTWFHTDFKDKFIRAEVIMWDKLLRNWFVCHRAKRLGSY